MKPVHQLSIRNGMTINELLISMRSVGVMGCGRLAQAADILEQMIQDKKCTVFFGQAGALIPGGMRTILVDMLRKKYVDVFVTTGATLTHDLAEALGFPHEIGRHDGDDATLHKQGKDRMWDSYMNNRVYEAMEDFFEKHWDVFCTAKTIRELIFLIGSKVTDKNSLLRVAYEENIPLFCPALADSGIGLMIYGRKAKGKEIHVDAFEDMKDIMDIAWTSQKTGVFYLGGGVPKNFIQQAMQFSPQSASFGVQVTMDRAEFGGSSGASLKEGISWGKMNPKGTFVDVFLDTTVALPLLYGALQERIKS